MFTNKEKYCWSGLSVELKIHQGYPLQRIKIVLAPKRYILGITWNYIWLWGSDSGALESVRPSFIAITPLCALLQTSSTCQGPIYGLNYLKVICVIFWPLTRPKNTIPRWYTGRKWHIPTASNRKRSRGRIKAYDMGQGEGLIVPWQSCTGRE